MTKSLNTIVLISSALIVILLVGSAVAILYASGISAVVGLPMLSVGAVIVLVILLCSMAVVFASFDLQDKSQALALPEGSIRAVIALMLIVLFAILTIYLYGSLATGELTHLGPVAVGTRDALIKTYGERNIVSVANDGGYDVWVRNTATQDGVDFAKQLLVLVGTLVTSISSFYFGSKAASPANEQTTSAIQAPVITSLNPSTYERGAGEQNFTVMGSNLDRITGLKLAMNGRQISATNVIATANQVHFKFDAPAAEAPGMWSITLIDSKLGEKVTSNSLKIT